MVRLFNTHITINNSDYSVGDRIVYSDFIEKEIIGYIHHMEIGKERVVFWVLIDKELGYEVDNIKPLYLYIDEKFNKQQEITIKHYN